MTYYYVTITATDVPAFIAYVGGVVVAQYPAAHVVANHSDYYCGQNDFDPLFPVIDSRSAAAVVQVDGFDSVRAVTAAIHGSPFDGQVRRVRASFVPFAGNVIYAQR